MGFTEEVVMRMGLDARPVSSALRGVRRDWQNFKKDLTAGNIGGALKGGLASLGIGISVGALAAFAKGAGHMAENLRTMSEELGVSTDFLQQWEIAAERSNSSADAADAGIERLARTIGDARTGQEDAVKVFRKYGIELDDANGKAKTTEQVFDAVRKKIVEQEDPALRAAIAFDLFGKRGQELTAALKDLEKVKADTKGSIISETELATLHKMNESVEGLWGRIKRFGAKGLAIALTPFFGSDADVIRQNIEKRAAEGAGGSLGPTEKQIKEAKEYAKAFEDIRKARRDLAFAGANEENKIFKLQMEQRDIQRKINDLKGESLEKLKLEKDLIEKQKDIAEAQHDLEKKRAEDREKADKKKQDDLKKEDQMVRNINDSLASRQGARQDFANAFSDRAGLTLEELAGRRVMRRTSGWGRRFFEDFESPAGAQAQQVLNLRAQAKEARLFGNKDLADSLLKQSDQIASGLGNFLKSDEANPMASAAKSLESADKNLAELLRKASEEGLRFDIQE